MAWAAVDVSVQFSLVHTVIVCCAVLCRFAMAMPSMVVLAALHNSCICTTARGLRLGYQDGAGMWKQCGGSTNCPSSVPCGDNAWNVTVCPEGFGCKRLDAFYWQCKPGSKTAVKPGSNNSRLLGPYAQCGGTNGPCPSPPCRDVKWGECQSGFVCDRYSAFFWSCKPGVDQRHSPDGTAMVAQRTMPQPPTSPATISCPVRAGRSVAGPRSWQQKRC